MTTRLDIEFKGAVFEVEFDFSRSEAETLNYPGAPASVSILTVAHKDGLMNQFFEEMDLWEQLEEVVLEKANG